MSHASRCPIKLGLMFVGLMAASHTTPSLAASPAGDAILGKKQYEAKCGGCHSPDANRVGPLHRGVVGRPAGAVAGYNYSPALKRFKSTWTPQRLDSWLQNPQKLVPGTKMYLSVTDSEVRKNIIAYLQTLSLGSTVEPKPH